VSVRPSRTCSSSKQQQAAASSSKQQQAASSKQQAEQHQPHAFCNIKINKQSGAAFKGSRSPLCAAFDTNVVC